jgi:hypothetical protein
MVMANTAVIILNIYYIRTVTNRQWKRYYLITGLIQGRGRASRILRKKMVICILKGGIDWTYLLHGAESFLRS